MTYFIWYANAHLKINKPSLLNVINHLGTPNGLIKILPRCTEFVRKSKLYSNFPNDPIIRGSFFKFRKIYSKCCKQKYKSFRTSIINKSNFLNDTYPNAYWKLLKDLQDDKQFDQFEKISSDQWVNHFSKLFSFDEKFGPQNKYFEKLLIISEKSKTFSALDFRITDKEAIHVINNLKNNKSAGLDGIKNEMLKTGIKPLLPYMLKLFNLILTSGKYQRE